jgi:hypothetical protein
MWDQPIFDKGQKGKNSVFNKWFEEVGSLSYPILKKKNLK